MGQIHAQEKSHSKKAHTKKSYLKKKKTLSQQTLKDDPEQSNIPTQINPRFQQYQKH